MLIKITVPDKNGQWKVQINSGTSKKERAVSTYRFVEQRIGRFLGTSKKVKIDVTVNYCAMHPLEPNDWKNTGFYSSTNEALYALACFLEDFVTEEFLAKKRKLYFMKNENLEG